MDLNGGRGDQKREESPTHGARDCPAAMRRRVTRCRGFTTAPTLTLVGASPRETVNHKVGMFPRTNTF